MSNEFDFLFSLLFMKKINWGILFFFQSNLQGQPFAFGERVDDWQNQTSRKSSNETQTFQLLLNLKILIVIKPEDINCN